MFFATVYTCFHIVSVPIGYIPVSSIIDLTNQFIQISSVTYTEFFQEFNTDGLSIQALSAMHTHLTSILINYHLFFQTIQNSIFTYNTADLAVLQDQSNRILVSIIRLFVLYRQVETSLGISVTDSPISTQM